jgi:hypothetical protein
LIALRANISDSNSVSFRTALAILIGSAFFCYRSSQQSASNSAWFAPCPLNGLIGWAASPISVGPPFLIIRIRVIFGHRQDIQKPELLKSLLKFGNRIVPLCSPAGFF